MSRTILSLATGAAALACLAIPSGTYAQGPPTVEVRDVDSPARQPFQKTINLSSVSSFTVPAGKRLVIEFISANLFMGLECELFLATLFTDAGGEDAAHYFLGTEAPSDLVNAYAVTEMTRIYADPGSTVAFNTGLSGQNCMTSSAAGALTVSGHLVTAVQ